MTNKNCHRVSITDEWKQNWTTELLYNRKTKEVRNTITNEENRLWVKKCEEVNTHIGERRNTEAWRFVRASAREKQDKVCIQVTTLNEWMKHYANVLTEERQEYRIEIEHKINVEGEPVEVTPETVKKTITNLKNDKASVPEGIPGELLKNGTEKLYRMLTKVMNECLNGHPPPEQWKIAHISPVHKRVAKKIQTTTVVSL
ncbi:hypothetical protein HHI36_001545 [Cryptolaemus montrouzieri]|uniref:Endonuclease-reverse transcriptase n=1 Tax=Cryptolaemus montrouzieri TaxID=559131 RepID=A0ABD2P8K2_9CUCU